MGPCSHEVGRFTPARDSGRALDTRRGPGHSGGSASRGRGRGSAELWTLVVILLVLWLLGFATHAVGDLVHLLLVVAVIVLVYQLVTGRRAV